MDSVSLIVSCKLSRLACQGQIGRGQRELILGDRQTGKTAIAVVRYLVRKTRMSCAFIARSGRARPAWRRWLRP
jgi:F0F1-type ATP synthase alpha subunit